MQFQIIFLFCEQIWKKKKIFLNSIRYEELRTIHLITVSRFNTKVLKFDDF